MFELYNFIKMFKALGKKTAPVAKELGEGWTSSEIKAAIRNAVAYGWEVGHGQDMTEVVASSKDNPFMKLETIQGMGLDG